MKTTRRSRAVDTAPRPTPPARARNLPTIASAASVLAGALAVAGGAVWTVHDPVGHNADVGPIGIKINTAIVLVLLAGAGLLPRRFGVVLGVLAVVFGAAVLLEYWVGNLGFDQVLVHDPNRGAHHPGRPAVGAAAVLILLGAERVLHDRGHGRRAQACSLAVVLASMLSLLGVVFGVDSLHRNQPYTAVSVFAALSAALLGVAGLASVDGGGLTWAVRGTDAGAALVRRLLPVALVGLPLLGYACLLAERHGLVDGAGTVVLFVVVCSLAVGVLTWAAARRLQRIDLGRSRTVAELVTLKDDLARQVEERATVAKHRGGQIAVLEDRQRIAADLHDIVIQRLFAAGMFLQGADPGERDPATSARISTAVEAMDGAIRDLRNSIFELGGHHLSPVALATAVEQLCVESSRILGFVPAAAVDDLVPDSLHEDVLAVIRETLANVAKHAGASRIDVEVRSGSTDLTVTVTDDGVGMTAVPHSSGIRNMLDRAVRRGGTCTWRSVDPHGTQVCWQIPY